MKVNEMISMLLKLPPNSSVNIEDMDGKAYDFELNIHDEQYDETEKEALIIINNWEW